MLGRCKLSLTPAFSTGSERDHWPSHFDAYLKHIEHEGFLPSSVPMQVYASRRMCFDTPQRWNCCRQVWIGLS
jgi:hypothetical protein